MIFEPIIAAAKLANLGLAALVAEACIWRFMERRKGQPIKLNTKRMNSVSPDAVILMGMLMAASSFAFLTLPVTHYIFQWPSSPRIPEVQLLALWLKGSVDVSLILTLSHHPRRKMVIIAGWTLASHLFIVGPAAWTLIR